MSVESKDSDGDSAKSSLADGTSTNGLPEPDFSKEDSTDTLYSGDKLGSDSSKPKNEQVPTINKKDEGYVSAEKDQNDNAEQVSEKLSLLAAEKILDIIDDIFEDADEDGDGFVDYEEFVKNCGKKA